MLNHLATIYIDPYKVQNARYEFHRLVIKLLQLFSKFHTKFIYLASVAKIPTDK